VIEIMIKRHSFTVGIMFSVLRKFKQIMYYRKDL